MSPLVRKALEAITARTNLMTGLAHPNDMNAAKEMFLRLHNAGEVVQASEISVWANANGWQPRDAKELGDLGERTGAGSKPRIKDGPWWTDNVIENLRGEAGIAGAASKDN